MTYFLAEIATVESTIILQDLTVLEDFLMGKTFDPLKYIPSADAVRNRLAEIHEEARRLDILLQTAEAIEQGETAECRQEVRDG